MAKRNIYLASSWRNKDHAAVLAALRDDGHEVFDFKSKEPLEWGNKTPPTDHTSMVNLLLDPEVQDYFLSDLRAMRAADTGVLLLPAGRDAHQEIGWLAGAGRQTFVLTMSEKYEHGFMYLLHNGIVETLDDLLRMLHSYPQGLTLASNGSAVFKI